MPIFMDRHDIGGVTAQDVAEAHQQDLKVQDKYGCKALMYWFDKERGTAFCLIEADNRNAVVAMHNEAHGLIPHRIIEVDSHLVEAFLGRIEDPIPERNSSEHHQYIIEEPAFRAILFANLKNKPLLQIEKKPEQVRNLISNCSKIIQDNIELFNGRKIDRASNGFTASFSSVSNSVQSALEIQNQFRDLNSHSNDIHVQLGVGISAGDPVTKREDFFGEVVQTAERLCHIANGGEVVVSSVVKEQYKKENFGLFPEESSLKPLESVDEDFLNRLMDTTEENWNRERFTLDNLSKHIGVSKSQLYRKTFKLTGLTAANFVKDYRLQKARKMIEAKQGNISQIAFETGFSNPSYFSKSFQNHFGILPSDYSNRFE